MYTSKRLSALLFFLFFVLFQLISLSPGLRAGEQAESAIRGVRQLIAEGRIEENTTLKIVVKQGNIRNYWGTDFALKNEWEQKSGILIDANVMPQMPVLKFLQDNRDFDLTIARQREYPDLVSQDLILDLTPFVRKYGMRFTSNRRDGYLHPDAQTEYDGRIVAIPADGDIAVLYLRKDMLTDPEQQACFRKQYHKELTPPQTWADYLQLLRFFHSPEDQLYGSCEERDLHTGWMFWMLRYASQANPVQYLFDDEMHPLIDSPAGIQATEQYVATVPYSPPEVLKEGNNYSYTLPFFKNGQCFSLILTMSAAKVLNTNRSLVKDKFMLSPMPGNLVDGQLVRKSSFIYGNNLVIAKNSKHPELAFLYAMWLSDPEISARSVMVTGGMADPFRYNHLSNPALQQLYTKQALDTVLAQAEHTVPAGTGLPGDSEYIASLNRNIWRAAKKELSPEEAMKRTAREWEQITQRHGRSEQISFWKSFKRKYRPSQSGLSRLN